MGLLVVCGLAVAQAQLRVFNLRATNLPADIFGIADAYIKVFCGSTALGVTVVRHNNRNPWWDEEFGYYSAQEGDGLRLEVYDEDAIFDDLVGQCGRQLKYGTHDIECYLEEGGSLH